jgi:hypothetical protein
LPKAIANPQIKKATKNRMAPDLPIEQSVYLLPTSVSGTTTATKSVKSSAFTAHTLAAVVPVLIRNRARLVH